jgi:hypothetical protein
MDKKTRASRCLKVGSQCCNMVAAANHDMSGTVPLRCMKTPSDGLLNKPWPSHPVSIPKRNRCAFAQYLNLPRSAHAPLF